MVHFAEIDSSNRVIRVVVCDSREWCENNLGGTWVRTYYNTAGKIYAGIGFTYHSEDENFSPPQPYPSWILNTETYKWEAPVERPEGNYRWDEDTTSWVLASSQ